ncbi:head maturation protease, ClpP-related [Pseudobacillus badius]|uniref:head maturation protease, ClpP-related n=1 Tax=Bacillus badius TaxID=1455 RepID=UPI000AAD393C|nr:head maturation protease, ClpP-related [Bacillus badius]
MAHEMFKNEHIKKFINMEKPKNEAANEIYVYGEIGDSWWSESVSANAIKRKLSAITSGDIHLYINSFGGDVFDGIAIYNQLKRHSSKVVVHVDGIAASAASLIAMAGDEIIMPANAMLMVHRASTFAWGNRDVFEQTLNALDKVDESVTNTYMNRFVGERSEMEDLLKNETWLTADEAKAFGLCDEIVDEINLEENKDEEPSPEEIKNSLLQKYAAQTTPEAKQQESNQIEMKNNLLAKFKRA